MTMNASRVAALLDTEGSVWLRDHQDNPETASAIEQAVRLGLPDAPYWDDNSVPLDGIVTVSITVTAVNIASDNSYLVQIVSDAVAAMTSPTVLASTTVGSTGSFKLPVNLRDVKKADNGATRIAARCVLSGSSSPSLSYSASIVRNER